MGIKYRLNVAYNDETYGLLDRIISGEVGIELDFSNLNIKSIKNLRSIPTKKIILPESLELIESYAFESSLLEEISIPDAVTEISYKAFANCTNLKYITFSNSLKIIGNQAFYENDLREIVIPENIEKIGDYAFAFCYNLNSIRYLGTVNQWQKISLGYMWNVDIPATYVQCSDGQVQL